MVKVTLKDGSKIEVEQGATILEVAKKISEGLARVATCGEIDGEIKDLRYEIQKDCNLVIHTFNEEDLDGKKAYWHTTSHIMAQAVQRLFPDVKFAIGPSINEGFYYDFDVEKPFTDEDKAKIEEEMKKIIKEDIKIERFALPKREALELMKEYGISARLTFSNSLLREEHLSDRKCNELCKLFEETGQKRNGVIIYSDLLLDYIKKHYKGLYFVSSTTKVLTNFEEFLNEVKKEDFKYVVPDFRLNKAFDQLKKLSNVEKDKVEFLCNECCWYGCKERKQCYETVSRKNLGENISEHICQAPEADQGYRFSKAMKNPGFISVDDIKNTYLPMGFSNFKIEGRSLGSALVLEFLLYYMVKPEYQIHVREEVYLDNMLDLF